LKVAAVSLSDRIFQYWPHSERDQLTRSQQDLFQSEIKGLEINRSSSQIISQHYLHSSENLFLGHVLLGNVNSLNSLETFHPKELKMALERTPETLADAAILWESIVNDLFRGRNRPIPNWPQFVEIQEGLGIYGTTRYHRLTRDLKKRAQGRLKGIFEKLSLRFPGWKWAVRKHCYLTAAFWDRYRLPSGEYCC
jgi:hypothetical protein